MRPAFSWVQLKLWAGRLAGQTPCRLKLDERSVILARLKEQAPTDSASALPRASVAMAAGQPDLISSDAGRGGWRWVGCDRSVAPRDGFAGAPQIRNERGQR